MTAIAVIPARVGFSRFPGEPLDRIRGMQMVEHVYHGTAMSQSLDEVVIATPDVEIRRAMEVAVGAKVFMTSPLHERCTDRVAEAAEHLDADIVVNVQGDEPFIHPGMIDLVVDHLAEEATLHGADGSLR